MPKSRNRPDKKRRRVLKVYKTVQTKFGSVTKLVGKKTTDKN